MGEIADMMLEGILCQGCGIVLSHDGDGYPQSCNVCAKEELRTASSSPKHKCPVCGKKVKGMKDHIKAVHSTIS